MNWRRSVPGWLSLGMLAAIVAGALVAYGWIKPYLEGADLAITTLYRPKPVPVKVETVKWLTKVKTEKVPVQIEVIREVPAKVEKKLLGFGLNLKELRAENKELVDVIAVPKAPFGGEMALTASTDSGKINGIFKPNSAPLVQFGGLREVGVEYDPLNASAGGYYRQDLVRVGPAIVNGRAFVAAPITPGGKPLTFGVAVGVSVRF